MNLTTQNAKNLISKDNEASKKAAQDIVNNIDIKSFQTLCENSQYMFDFVIDKVVKNLILATNTNNLKATFEFSKFYDTQIGEYVNQAWQRFANEELTDKILEFFETGSEEQKIYAAKYFEKINDPLALEWLNKYAISENESLSSACAFTLGIFNDETSRNKALLMLNDNDEFAKFSAIKFLINYSRKEDLKFVINTMENCAFSTNIAQEILYTHDINTLKDTLNEDEFLKLTDEIISGYPEDIPLDTVLDFNITELLEILNRNKNSYATRILTDAKNIFGLIISDTIYTYDLTKEHLRAIKNLNNMLQNINIDVLTIKNELFKTPKRAQRALNTIISLNNNIFSNEIQKLYAQTNDSTLLCECARVAKALDIILDKNTGLNKISDNNAKELFKSYF